MYDKIRFCCLSCKNDLIVSEGYMACMHCSKQWDFREGIPSFAESDFYWNEVPKEEMEIVLKGADERGWKTVLYEILWPRYKRDFGIICDERRADWKFLLPLTKESIVLDIGSGWGAIPIALSEVCGKVVALDATFERIKFLNIRRFQEKINNLFPVHGGDGLHFPFPKHYFDLISMVGVLEWVATSYSYDNLDPYQVQLKALKNINAILKKNGYLYIGIENRFGYNYLMGKADHNGLRFVSLMPRWLANLISKKYVGEPYTTYQYSMRGYAKLLREAGFSNIQFYAPLPQYRSPRFYLPLDNLNAQKYFLTNLFGLFEMTPPEKRKDYRLEYKIAKTCVKIGLSLKLLSLLKYVVPGFSIIAKK